MVVSEIIDRLSPNMAPPTTAPRASGTDSSVAPAKPTAMGAVAAMVPMEVPMAVAIKAEIRNRAGNTHSAGMMVSPSLTVASTLPMLSLTLANAPASRNTRHISNRLG